MDKPTNKLFEEFRPVATSEYEEKILKDLKGADYEKRLVWRTGEGFNARPYYRREDIGKMDHLDSYPGNFPFVRGKKVHDNNWFVRQEMKVTDLEKANEKALDILMKGIDSLGFKLDPEKEYTREDLDVLLKNIFAEIVEINFNGSAHALALMENHYENLQHYNREFSKVHGSINYDPLGRLITKGKWFESETGDFETCKKLIEIAAHLPHFKVIGVNGVNFHEAGSSTVEELAFSLSAGVEYLTRLTEMGLSINDVAPNIKFSFGISSNYFMEIAKFRAARWLWAKIVKSYGPSRDEIGQMNIHAITSGKNMTLYDPYVNLLRSTTESMSSIIAGIDSLTVRPFNEVMGEDGEFAERIARNQQLLLKEESYLDKVVDPSAGSYYIEALTDSIAREAWKLFLETEEKGGFIQAVRSSFIQDRISKSAGEKLRAVATRKYYILGTNQYPNFSETIDTDDPRKLLGVKEEPENTEFRTIHPVRISVGFEELRLRTDQYAKNNKRPVAFMFTYGNLAMRIARSQFSRNFFSCAGYDVIDNLGFKTTDEGVKACLDSKPEIVVICSSDEEYPDIVPEIVEKLNDKTHLVLAGYPKDSVEKLKEAGMKHFIHTRSNVLETLTGFHELLGIPGLKS